VGKQGSGEASTRSRAGVRACVLLSTLLCSACGSSSEKEENPCAVPRVDLLSDFSNGDGVDDGGSLYGGAYAYPDGVASNTSEHDLHVTGTVDDFGGFGFWFGSCVDASSYDGLEFELGGDPGVAGDVLLVIGTRENDPRPPVTDLGTCTPTDPQAPYADCLPAAAPIIVPENPELVRVPFSDLSEGVPHPDVDPSQITSITFWLAWSEEFEPYDVDLRLDEVSFYSN